MGARTGAQYLAGLRDGRQIFVNGECVSDISDYPPFQRGAAELARVYDLQSDPTYAAVLTFPSPRDGAPVSTSFMRAKTRDELDRRVQGESLRADLTYGLMGRLPDYMNAFATDCAAIGYLLGHRQPEFGERAVAYWEHVRDNDIALTHVLVDPHIDKSKGVEASQAMRVVEETNDGLVVEGCKMLSTLAPLSDEIYIAPYMPRKPGEEAYTLIGSIPVASDGLKFIARESYDHGYSVYDRPLSSRFDEQDALAVFDRVLVPWDRVFMYGDIELYNLTSPAYPGYLVLQAAIRATAKLRFVAGVCALVAETNGRSAVARYQEMVGELLGLLEIAEGLVVAIAAEVERNCKNPLPVPDGKQTAPLAAVPGLATLFGGVGRTSLGITTVRLFFPMAHQKAAEALRLIGSSGLIMTPTEADFENAALAPYLDRYLQGRDGLAAKDRVRVFKLAWDLLGEAFGSRSLLYEHFFAGDPINNRLLYWNLPTKDKAQAMAERMIEEIIARSPD
jgi:aromatic ring hydroxylase